MQSSTAESENAPNYSAFHDDHSLHGAVSPLPPSPVSDEQIAYSSIPECYCLGVVLGYGSSALVRHALHLPTNTAVAIKTIDLEHFERSQIDELRQEIQTMSMCRHPNVAKVLAAFVSGSKLWIVMPLMSAGSCLELLRHVGPFNESIISAILRQALKGLVYLHANGNIHRDLKAGNLLVDGDGTVRVADFGVSAKVVEDVTRGKNSRMTFVGTPCWMAPEVMEMTHGYNEKADIWSLGITALELAYGTAPYAGMAPMKIVCRTLSDPPPVLDKSRCVHKYSRAFREFVECCLQKDPSKRPSAEQLLKHPFFRSARKKEYLVDQLLTRIPPLLERQQMERPPSLLGGGETDDEPLATEDGWDFDEDKAEEGSDLATSSRKSRFKIDAAFENGAAAITVADQRSASNSRAGTPKAPDSATETRKGRFSVLDNGTTVGGGETPANGTRNASVWAHDSEEKIGERTSETGKDKSADGCEGEGKKSRFEVHKQTTLTVEEGKRLVGLGASEPSTAELGECPTSLTMANQPTENGMQLQEGPSSVAGSATTSRRGRFQLEVHSVDFTPRLNQGETMTLPIQPLACHEPKSRIATEMDRLQRQFTTMLSHQAAGTDQPNMYGLDETADSSFPVPDRIISPSVPPSQMNNAHTRGNSPVAVQQAQIDHLLFLNDLQRQQLIDLRWGLTVASASMAGSALQSPRVGRGADDGENGAFDANGNGLAHRIQNQAMPFYPQRPLWMDHHTTASMCSLGRHPNISPYATLPSNSRINMTGHHYGRSMFGQRGNGFSSADDGHQSAHNGNHTARQNGSFSGNPAHCQSHGTMASRAESQDHDQSDLKLQKEIERLRAENAHLRAVSSASNSTSISTIGAE